jgi:hypothetical protein
MASTQSDKISRIRIRIDHTSQALAKPFGRPRSSLRINPLSPIYTQSSFCLTARLCTHSQWPDMGNHDSSSPQRESENHRMIRSAMPALGLRTIHTVGHSFAVAGDIPRQSPVDFI